MRNTYIYILGIFKNKKLHMFLWFLILLWILWGFQYPDEFTIHKWGTHSPKDQYFILTFSLGIAIYKLIHIYSTIKKESKTKE